MTDEDPAAPIVDAHIHFWDPTAFTLPWLAGVPELAGAFLPAQYLRDSAGLSRDAVAVQAGEELDEAVWLVSTTSGPNGVVSKVVLQFAADAAGWAGRVTPALRSASRSFVAGVRIPLHDERDDWLELPGVAELLRSLEREGMVLELLLRPSQLAAVDTLARRHPSLRVVLCHLGLATGDPGPAWRSRMRKLGAHETVAAKVSGLFDHRCNPEENHARASHVVAVALDAFGPRRLMFGSDWPMSTRVAGYREIVERTRIAIGDVTPAEAARIWWGTAASVYGIDADLAHPRSRGGGPITGFGSPAGFHPKV